MVRVSPYQQDQLASSQTGTPGADLTQSRGLANAASGFGKLGETLNTYSNSILQAFQVDAASRQADANRLNRMMEDATRDSAVTAAISSADVDFTAMDRDLRAQYQNDTTGWGESFAKQSKALSDKALQNISDPLVRVKVQAGLTVKAAQYQNDLERWASDRQLPILDQNIEKAAGNFSVSLNDANLSGAQVGQKIQSYIHANRGNFEFRYGAAAEEEMRKRIVPGIKNYLHETAIRSPNLLDDRVGIFRSFLSGQDESQFMAEIRRDALVVKQQQDLDLKMGQKAARLGLTQDLINASPTGDPDDAPPAQAREIHRKYTTQLSPEDNIQFQIRRANAAKTLEAKSKQLAKESAATEKLLQSQYRAEDELTSMKFLGGYASRLESMASRIEQDYLKLRTGNLSEQAHNALSNRLQAKIGQYDDEYQAVHRLVKSFQSQHAKDKASGVVLNATSRFQSIQGYLNQEPGAIAAKSARAKLKGALPPIPINGYYSNPQKQHLFNYYYNSFLDNELQVMSASRASAIFREEATRRRFHEQLKKQAAYQVEHIGFLH